MVDISELAGGPIQMGFCSILDSEKGLELCLAHIYDSYVSELRYVEEEKTLYVDMVEAQDYNCWVQFPHLVPVQLPEGIEAVKLGTVEVRDEILDPHPYYTEGIPQIESE